MAANEEHTAEFKAQDLTVAEKRAYLLGLITLANSDDRFSDEERQVIADAAKRLGAAVKPKDFRTHDIVEIAQDVERPTLRSMFFRDFLAMARSDQNIDLEERKILKYLATQWDQPLPDVPGLDWDQVPVPEEAEMREISAVRRAGQDRELALAEASFRERASYVFLGAVVWMGVVSLAVFGLVAILPFDASGKLFELAAESYPLNLVLLGVLGLVGGYVIALVTPGRTVLEPALGALIPMVLLAVIIVRVHLMLRGIFSHSPGEPPSILGEAFGRLALNSIVLFASTYGGALIGERVQAGLKRGAQ